MTSRKTLLYSSHMHRDASEGSFWFNESLASTSKLSQGKKKINPLQDFRSRDFYLKKKKKIPMSSFDENKEAKGKK